MIRVTILETSSIIYMYILFTRNFVSPKLTILFFSKSFPSDFDFAFKSLSVIS